MDFKHLMCLFTKEGKWYLYDCLTLSVNLVITYLDLQYKDIHKTFWSTFCYNKPSLYSIIMWGSPITSLCEGSFRISSKPMHSSFPLRVSSAIFEL